MQRKKSKQSGFTLVELLIVIIIIGILAAIAFVTYSGAQNKAHKADAQSTLAEVKNKLAEYNADNSNYPVDQPALNTWLGSADGGNNTTLSTKFVSANGYTYAADPAGCTNADANSQCNGFTLTADKSIFKGDTDLTIKN